MSAVPIYVVDLGGSLYEHLRAQAGLRAARLERAAPNQEPQHARPVAYLIAPGEATHDDVTRLAVENALHLVIDRHGRVLLTPIVMPGDQKLHSLDKALIAEAA